MKEDEYIKALKDSASKLESVIRHILAINKIKGIDSLRAKLLILDPALDLTNQTIKYVETLKDSYSGEELKEINKNMEFLQEAKKTMLEFKDKTKDELKIIGTIVN